MSLKLEWFKTVLMPAQHILQKLDPENQRSVEDVISDLQPLQDQYMNLVVRNQPDLGAAGTKRKRLIAEYAAAKKKVESKIKFMKVPEGPKVQRDSSGSSQRDLSFPTQSFPPHPKARRRYPP
jgi:hypothetical protein